MNKKWCAIFYISILHIRKAKKKEYEEKQVKRKKNRKRNKPFLSTIS